MLAKTCFDMLMFLAVVPLLLLLLLLLFVLRLKNGECPQCFAGDLVKHRYLLNLHDQASRLMNHIYSELSGACLGKQSVRRINVPAAF